MKLWRCRIINEKWFQKNDVPLHLRALNVYVDMRYFGQNYELTIPLKRTKISSNTVYTLRKKFHETHASRYGHSSPEESIQVVNLRLSAVQKSPRIKIPKFLPQKRQEKKPAKKERRLWSNEKWGEISVFERESLRPGFECQGPAIIQENESTTLIRSGWQLKVDLLGHLVIGRNSH